MSEPFAYYDGELWCEDVSAASLAERHGTPLYVYSHAALAERFDAFVEAFERLSPLACFSVKSCGNVHVCRRLVERGAGLDVVSGGELRRAQAAGVPMDRVVFAGVGKTDPEIRAALEAGIGCFNVESEAELERLSALAGETGAKPRAALRINPDVDPATHAKTTTGKKETKFGVDLERARAFFDRYANDPHVRLNGVHAHIGSPIDRIEPYVSAAEKLLAFAEDVGGIETLNLGGGFGTDYETGQSPDYAAYAAELVPRLEPFVSRGGRIVFEPGRSIAAHAGVLLTRVTYIKESGRKTFAVIDSGMHHLLRPTLYDAFHFLWPVRVGAGHAPSRRQAEMPMEGLERYDVVGPICETGDFFAKDRDLPPLQRGDLLAVFGAGAYGMTMASNYNAMPRPAEALVDADDDRIIRRAETWEDLIRPEIEADGRAGERRGFA